MYDYKRWMIGLDNSPMDNIIISYIEFLTSVLSPDKIYFVHVIKDLDVPEKIRKEFPELNKPLDEKIECEMKKHVERNLKNYEDLNIEYEALEGNPLEQMLTWSHIKNIDLLIVGRKFELDGGGILPQKLARKIACSVLFIPEQPNNKFEKIIVATDFSTNSKLAIETALSLANKNKNTTIYCYHSFQLPLGYYSTGKTDEEFAEIMKKNATEHFYEFRETLNYKNTNMTFMVEWDKKNSTANCINNTACKNCTDLIVIGARGRTGLTSFLLGSVTEKLIMENQNIPLLVVKEKDKALNFLELIKTI